MGTPPSLGNETLFAAYVTRSNTILITTKLVDIVYLVGLIVFAAGLRHLIRRMRPDYEWLAGFWHRQPQPGRGSSDLRGERVHGGRDWRGNHLYRLVRVH
jgi:hypothetical protein